MSTTPTSRPWRVLPDGSQLTNPEPQPPSALQLGQWAYVDGRAYRIINMRQAAASSRVVEFHGHAPVLVTNGRPLRVFQVIPAPARPAPYPVRW
ncbi:hypothetical protein [Actinacidiphila rubida]|uniref:Uncharacterized protein n=1 Tax=Actinacidiphila rubida TaxID=310780 RepID=A0A1H8QMD3_9ACTN|nr:hypothetical protein [Actinacidiphila rubida]SEO55352.1 hypothetical protein SAMN05216267_103075 [Actinacidiphila rubida]